MNIRQLALKNVKGNWRSYKAFLYSSIFSVIIFFMYASFIYHPDVVDGQIREQVRKALVECNYLIIGFSVLFILYSNATFLRSRKKELGLLTLLGATKTQISRILIWEQLLIGVISIVIGIGTGTLFSKLFFMMMSNLLGVDNPIPFVWNIVPIYKTALTYFFVFFILAILGLWNIRKLEIIQLLKDARKQRIEPFASKWLLLVGVIAILAAYVLAVQVKLTNFNYYFFPVVGLVIVGTYFFFTQGSIAILKMMKKRKETYYKNPNLFVISNLVYKMKDNARFLFTITILMTIVVSATGTMATYAAELKNLVLKSRPHAIAYTSQGTADEFISENEMNRQLQKHGFQDVKKAILETLSAKFPSNMGKELSVSIVSEEAYNQLATQLGKRILSNKAGSGTLVYPESYGDFRFYTSDVFQFTMQGKTNNMRLNEQYTASVINSDELLDLLFVVNTEDYQKLAATVSDHDKNIYHGYEISNWEKTAPLVNDIRNSVPVDKKYRVTESVLSYNEVKQGGALTLFIGAFISILFFFAACSMTYFKWFHDIERDRLQYKSLMRTGMTRKEIKAIAIGQMGTIFFIPIIVGSIHSAIAMYALSNMLRINLFQTSVVVISLYCTASFVYFWVAQREYMKHI